MAGETVVFFGNCPSETLANIYRSHLAAQREQRVYFVDTQSVLSEIGRRHLASADIVVVQQFDFPTKVTTEALRPGVRRYTFPMVAAGWLWPFTGQEHPRNADFPHMPGGPYPRE